MGASEAAAHSPSGTGTLPWWIRTLRIEERRLGFIVSSLLVFSKRKGQGAIVHHPAPPRRPSSSLLLQLVSPLFPFSLITLYLFSTNRPRPPPLWLSFIRSKPHFHHNTYPSRPFSLQMPSSCQIKALVENQFPPLSSSPPFTQVFSSPQLIVFRSKW